MLRYSGRIHRNIYIYSLALCSFALPLSIFLISVTQIILVLNWIFEESLKNRWWRVKRNKALWFFCSIYFLHIVGLIYASNYAMAFNDIRIKLPLIILPVIIAGSRKIELNELRIILNFYVTGVLISTLYSAFRIFEVQGDLLTQMKNISPFVWHIRLATMVVIAIAFIPSLVKYNSIKKTNIIYYILVVWFLFFVFIFQSFTGVFLLFALGVYFLIKLYINLQSLIGRWMLIVSAITIFLLVCNYLVNFYVTNFSPKSVKKATLELYTLSGNPYYHDRNGKSIESGHFVDIYICDKELLENWKLRSNLPWDYTDANGNTIRNTLIRYLTSLGLRKDSVGISKLTSSDIWNIEHGITNPIYLEKYSLNPRIYRIMWELYNYYVNKANPNGYSIPQRIEYLKTAFRIIRKNFWIGTGTGDMEDAMQQQFLNDHSPLSPEWRLRSHNQFVTFFITYGIIGLLIVVMAIFLPVWFLKCYSDYLVQVFIILLVLSMMSIDALEKHTGVSMAALFYSIFVFGKNVNDTSIEKTMD